LGLKVRMEVFVSDNSVIERDRDRAVFVNGTTPITSRSVKKWALLCTNVSAPVMLISIPTRRGSSLAHGSLLALILKQLVELRVNRNGRRTLGVEGM